MSAQTLAPPSINQLFADTLKTGLPQVHSEAWIVDEIGQTAFYEALENRTIIYVHDVDVLGDLGEWVPVPGYGLNKALL